MKKLLLPIVAISLLVASCGENKTAFTETTATATPKKKGRIFDKVNIVQIPLTAIENNIQGKVKSVRYADYKYIEQNGQFEKVLDDSGYNVYDSYGHLVDQNEYDEKGNLKWKCIYKYDANNRALEWDFNFSYKYDTSHSVTTFTYDANGNKTESNSISSNPKRSSKSVFKYDAAGNEIEEIAYSYDNKIAMIITSKYDQKGNQIEYAISYGNEKTKHRRTAEYDANNNKITGLFYGTGDSLQGKTTAVFDEYGNGIESKEYSPDGKYVNKTTRKFDKWGNCTEYLYYTAQGTLDTSGWNAAMEYEYDKMGNKMKETYYNLKAGKRIPDSYTEASYTYYE